MMCDVVLGDSEGSNLLKKLHFALKKFPVFKETGTKPTQKSNC